MSVPISPLLNVAGLSLAYGKGMVALEGVDLTLNRGEFLSLLGPSGCGKSTLLRLIAGLLKPSGGQLQWQSPIARGDIGFVFQEPTLMPWARVIDNVRLPLEIAGVPRAAATDRAMAELEKVGLRDFSKSYQRELSGGMKMRVSLARALVTRPALLLLDEPFAALDEITRLKLNDDLLSLWQRDGFTAIFVTHSVFESVYLSTRIAVMRPRPGRIVAELPVELPSQRDYATRTGAAYNDHCRTVSTLLHQAMGAAP